MDRWIDGWMDGTVAGTRDKGQETRKKWDSVQEVLTFQPSDVQKPLGFYTFEGSNVQKPIGF